MLPGGFFFSKLGSVLGKIAFASLWNPSSIHAWWLYTDFEEENGALHHCGFVVFHSVNHKGSCKPPLRNVLSHFFPNTTCMQECPELNLPPVVPCRNRCWIVYWGLAMFFFHNDFSLFERQYENNWGSVLFRRFSLTAVLVCSCLFYNVAYDCLVSVACGRLQAMRCGFTTVGAGTPGGGVLYSEIECLRAHLEL